MSSSTPPPSTNREDECSSPGSSSDPLMVEHPDKAIKMPKILDSRSCLDRLLQGYTKFMGPGINQDRGLKLMQYTIWMFSYALRDRVLVRDALRKLYNEFSFARYVLRLLALPTAVEAVRSGSWSVESNTKKGLHKFLGQILAWSMIGYYPLEHGAYVQWQTPKLLFPKTGGPSRFAEKLSAWSCRFWLAYTVTEIVQCWLKLREEQQNLKLIGDKKKIDDEDDDNGDEQAIINPPNPGVIRNLRLQILRDLLFTLPAIHWSLPNWDTQPWLTDPLVNTLMWLESVVCMYQSVASFQES